MDRGPRASATSSRPTRSSSCSSARSCRSSTSGGDDDPCPAAGCERVQDARSSPSARSSPPPAWCATTPSSSTSPPRPDAMRWPATAYAAGPGLAAWKARVPAGWKGVHVDHVDLTGRGRARHRAPVEAVVALGDLDRRRRRGAAAPRPRRPGRRARVPGHRADGLGGRRRRRPPPLTRPVQLRAGRPLRRHRAHRPGPPATSSPRSSSAVIAWGQLESRRWVSLASSAGRSVGLAGAVLEERLHADPGVVGGRRPRRRAAARGRGRRRG